MDSRVPQDGIWSGRIEVSDKSDSYVHFTISLVEFPRL